MVNRLKPVKPSIPADEPHCRIKRRPIWRQRLVEAERGISLGFRSDSTFFVHFFTGSIVVAAACVLGLSLIEWTILVLSLTLVLAAELFNQVLKAVWDAVGHHFTDRTQQALRMGTAAVLVTIVGALLTIGMVFGHRLSHLLGE